MKIPDLSNATPEFLADELGKIRRVMKEAKQQEGFYKTALAARMEPGVAVNGEVYRAGLTMQQQERLDTEAIKRDMPADWIKRYTKTIEFQVVRVERTDGQPEEE
jgi:hypothetical protein